MQKKADARREAVTLDPAPDPFILKVIQLEDFGVTRIVLRWSGKEIEGHSENLSTARTCSAGGLVQSKCIVA